MIIRRDPFNWLNDLNKLFDDKLNRSSQLDDSTVESGNWIPMVDIKEESDCFLLHVDVPGVNPEKIEISMENNVLSIKGSRDNISKEEKNNYHRVERVRGAFYRRFTLPDTVDPVLITAKSKQGVLEIRIGKKKNTQPSKIQIKVEE